MIALNTSQRLPSRAFWYVALRSLCVGIFALLLGWLVEAASTSPAVVCRGLMCGKGSGTLMAAFIDLFAAVLVLRALLNFKALSFLVTDRNITVNTGFLFQNSCTLRFDRIQDIDVARGPLHAMLGLKSLAIWTASGDQRVGKTRRPDGLLVLESGDADWLKDYMSDPPAVAAASADAAVAAAGRFAATSGAGQGGIGLAPLVVVAAFVAIALFAIVRKPAVRTPAASSAAATATPAAPSSALGASSTAVSAARHPHKVHVPAAANPDDYGIVCAIHPSGSPGVPHCAGSGAAERCGHEADFRSQPTPAPAVLTVVNNSQEPVRFYWLDRSGARALYASLPPGGRVNQQSHIGAHWLVSTGDGRCVGVFDAATETVGIF